MRRIVEAQVKYLPHYNVNVLTENEKDRADVAMSHAAEAPHHDPSIPLISCIHGLYWTAEEHWTSLYWHVNRLCIENMRRADAITAPSRWIGTMITRGMMRPVHVIPHGIELSEWEVSESQGYILWNKARTDQASDEKRLDAIAALLPDLPFVTTFGRAAPNVTVTGRVTYDSMKTMIHGAALYLATTRETFGIGTLEAMAAGVPIVGYDYGGQRELVENGVEGILVKPGDVSALADAIRLALSQRSKLGEAAREKAKLFEWRSTIDRYAQLIKDVAAPRIGPKVSIIVTTHDLLDYLPQCLSTVLAQSDPDWECIVVDDASSDLTPEFMQGFIREHPNFTYARTEDNVGLVRARTKGVELSKGKYIIFVDADDMLKPGAIEMLAGALEKRPDLTVAAGHLNVQRGNETNPTRNGWPFDSYDHDQQLKHINQIPYSSMVRKSHWLDIGGYRMRADRNEDAEMWCRMGSYGYRIEKVTQEPILVYRMRGDSKSQRELKKYGAEPDWTKWFPWKDHPDIMPFGSLSKPPNKLESWPVNSFHDPQVSVIIPVGPGHRSIVVDAIDSVLAQTYPFWECIVINDTGEGPLDLHGFPFVKQMATKRGPQGAGTARNLGTTLSTAPLLYFLDADDMLFPDALRQHVLAWNEASKSQRATLIYSDWIAIKDDENYPVVEAFDWDCSKILAGAKDAPTMLTSFLHSREMFDSVGGFDETLPGWEDWDYHIKLVTQAGVCGWRIPEPLIFYRMTTGQRRDLSKKLEGTIHREGSLLHTIYNRYQDYYPIGRGKKMCSCNGSSATVRVARSMNGGYKMAAPNSSDNLVLVEYHSPSMGKKIIVGSRTGTVYGRRMPGERFYVKAADVGSHPSGTEFTPVVELKQTPVPVNVTPLEGTKDIPQSETREPPSELLIEKIPDGFSVTKLASRNMNTGDLIKVLEAETIMVSTDPVLVAPLVVTPIEEDVKPKVKAKRKPGRPKSKKK